MGGREGVGPLILTSALDGVEQTTSNLCSFEPFAARRLAVTNRKTGCGNVVEHSLRDPHPFIVL